MSNARRFLEKLVSAEEASRQIPGMTPQCEHHRLCVGMATFDDFDGVWFTIQAIRLFHPEVADKLSFLIIDNHPEGTAAASLKGLEDWVPFLRYIPFRGYRGTSVRDLVFREANADIVCCVDSHVLIQPGALAALVRWFDEHPASMDLIQGPLLGDRLDGPTASHFDPAWGAAMYGQWALDDRVADPGGEPFEIGMQGLGLFACHRGASTHVSADSAARRAIFTRRCAGQADEFCVIQPWGGRTDLAALAGLRTTRHGRTASAITSSAGARSDGTPLAWRLISGRSSRGWEPPRTSKPCLRRRRAKRPARSASSTGFSA